MLVLDYLISNEDRHYRNFGLIRNVNTLKFERVAPIFDSGYSMFCQKIDALIGKDENSLPFSNKHSKQIKYANLSNYDFLKLDRIAEFAYKLYSKDKFMEAISIKRKDKLKENLESKLEKLKLLRDIGKVDK